MAQICVICGSKPLVGNRRSHSNIATKRRQNVNLQKFTLAGRSVRMCARCLKNQKARLVSAKA